MKRFALILIVAVLALGCVFADIKTQTSGDKFTVTTEIEKVYPVFQLIGSSTIDGTTTTKEATTAGNEIAGMVDGDTLKINVILNHFGKTNNDMSNALAAIRYKGNVDVTISAGQLVNKTEGATAASGHVMNSGDATNGAFTGIGAETDNFYSDNVTTTGASSVKITCHYVNGKKVAYDTSAKVAKIEQISTGSFSWDISDLTAGDIYKADVTITYTVE